MFATASLLKRTSRAAVLGIVLLSGAACVSTFRDHGYVPTEEDLAEIVVGVDTRDSVIETVGTPGASGVLNDSGFYYVATRFRHYGPTAPKPVSRELVAISFDTAGVVQGVERYGLQDGRVIPLERRVTDAGVADTTFLRQLLGNLGRIGPGAIIGDG